MIDIHDFSQTVKIFFTINMSFSMIVQNHRIHQLAVKMYSGGFSFQISTAQENKRTARSAYDPFDQQQEDVSFLLDTSLKQKWDQSFNQQQEQDISSLLNPQSNEISHNRFNLNNDRTSSFHGDTRVNDMLYAERRSGGLITPESDAEFVQTDTLRNPE